MRIFFFFFVSFCKVSKSAGRCVRAYPVSEKTRFTRRHFFFRTDTISSSIKKKKQTPSRDGYYIFPRKILVENTSAKYISKENFIFNAHLYRSELCYRLTFFQMGFFARLYNGKIRLYTATYLVKFPGKYVPFDNKWKNSFFNYTLFLYVVYGVFSISSTFFRDEN